jgi:hypothetical protein
MAIRYVFADALTGKVIEEVPLQSVSFTNTLDGGEFRGTFSLDQTGLDNAQLVDATTPGRCYVIAESGSRVWWGGLVWSRTYQSQAKSVQLYAKTLDQYPTKRIAESDVTFNTTGRRNIFRYLWAEMMQDANSIQVTLPPAFDNGDLQVPFTWSASEYKTYRSIMDQLSTSDGGFEWTVDWTRVGNTYTKALRIGQPLGQLEGVSNPVFEYPGNILNYWRNDTIGSGGTHIFGIGAGEGEAMPVIEVVHQDLIEGGFPRLDTSVTFKDVESLDALENLTVKQADILRVPQPIYTVQMKADREPAFGDWGLGDWCKLVIKDPLHPSPGTTYSTRILGWDYKPPQSDGAEEVQLMFQGDEAADG